MSEQIEYIEPTQEHVGQMVEVKYADGNRWVQAKLTGILQDDFRFAAKRDCDAFSYAWRFARIARPLTYAERQAKCGLKVGDRVKFVRVWDDGELGTSVRYYSAIDKYVGANGNIVDMCGEGVKVAVNVATWYLPYFVLEKVEDRRANSRDSGKTVYVDGNPSDDFVMEMAYQIPHQPWRAVLVKNDKRFVYELNNLRVKE